MGDKRAASAPEDGQTENPAAPGREAEEAAGSDSRDREDASRADLSRLRDLEGERDEYLELAQRTKADFENYRKRMAAETKAAAARGKAELAGGLVTVIDSLERALASAQIDPGAALDGKAVADGPLEQGIVLTFRELSATLSRAGVEAFDPAGESFDPNWHEAMQTRAVDGTSSGEVVETLQKGYRLDGQILRPARVVVSE